MERLEYYRECIQKLLMEYSQGKTIHGEIDIEIIFDTQRDRYLLVNLGWNEHRRIYNCILHLEIKNGQIWIQRNQTDIKIAEKLVEMGIPKQDIILGLQPVYVREDTGFGVA